MTKQECRALELAHEAANRPKVRNVGSRNKLRCVKYGAVRTCSDEARRESVLNQVIDYLIGHKVDQAESFKTPVKRRR